MKLKGKELEKHLREQVGRGWILDIDSFEENWIVVGTFTGKRMMVKLGGIGRNVMVGEEVCIEQICIGPDEEGEVFEVTK